VVRRIYGLTDDMVLAKNEREIRSMIERLEEYLGRKGLELNMEDKNHEIQKGRGKMEEI